MKTYGTAKLTKATWRIECEPHVMMKLKRVFGRFRGKTPKTMKLKDTLEVCRDLAWFCQRWPLIVTPADYLDRREEEHARRAEYVDALFTGRIEPRAFDLAIPARDYQRIAAETLLQRGRLLLADEVGLGKTASAIAALTDPATRPALVVTLAHLPKQWQREIKRFAPSMTTHILKKGRPYPIGGASPDQGKLFSDQFPDVIITNYHKLAGWADALAGRVRTIIFDEAQELRTGINRTPPAKYEAAQQIAEAAAYRCGLSATPIYNYGGEFFSVLQVIDPECIGTKSEFFAEWCPGGSSDAKAKISEPAAFGTYLRDQGIMLRRTRADVGRELPPISTVVHHVEADEEGLRAVEKGAAELARIILEAGGIGFDKMRAAEELNALLRQATGIAKAPYVAAFVRLLVESGEKVVLYGWHRAVYDIWQAQLADLNPVLYTGSESANQKQASVDAFTQGDAQVLIISLRAGAGLDGLQHTCRTVVFGELDWSPMVHEQNIGRVARDGQKDPVMAYMLLADTGSDPIVADVLGLKRAQSEGVRDPNRPLIEQLQVDHDHVKRLAEGYLKQVGRPVPERAVKAAKPKAREPEQQSLTAGADQ